ncbi:Holliday junction resolvase-like protein [Thermoproteota archaeon]
MNNLVEIFQSFRTILCVCPHCGDILRLSDLRLKYKGKAPRTWLDNHQTKEIRLENKELLFDEKENKLRKAAIEKGRAKVPKLVCKCIDENISCFNYDPYDIKALLHPVDFAVFNGLNSKKELEDITLISKKASDSILKNIRKSLEISIHKEQYDWQVARVSIEGNVTLE